MEDDRDGHACDGGGYGPPWMCEDEYLASLRDIPDEVLDAAPEGMAEELWLAAVEIEAARMPDPLADPQGVVLARSLAEVPDAECRDGALIDRITGYERQASWAGAGQARAIAELAQRRFTAGGQGELAFYVDEVALALSCSRQAAWAKVHTALDLVDRLPETLTALASGQICAVRARIIAEGTRALTDADARLVQDEVLAAAEVLTPSRLRARVAATVWAAVNTHAESGRETGDDRTADQRRADSLIDLMTAYLNGTCPPTSSASAPPSLPRPRPSPRPPKATPNPGQRSQPRVGTVMHLGGTSRPRCRPGVRSRSRSQRAGCSDTTPKHQC